MIGVGATVAISTPSPFSIAKKLALPESNSLIVRSRPASRKKPFSSAIQTDAGSRLASTHKVAFTSRIELESSIKGIRK